mmetsp:Transcript_36862/g.81990  ORF Transcript_36862/g.81990 Transcript_36862/m.81990 type:complete len:211 (-) Transcript_36862:1536-2168(-)
MATVGVRLWKDKKTQELYESKADLYAIIKATEKLERAYVRDSINAEAYESACEKLIQQFKVLYGSLRTLVPDVEKFMSEYNMQCPMAATRLLHSGLPATIEHKAKQKTNDPDAASVAETVQHFITAMDSLKLNLVAVDQICPILLDLINSMNKVQSLPPNFGPKEKAKEVYSRLYQKPANYELPEEDVRQLLYELESSYNIFLSTLKSRS